jgi:hypothetical protein
MIGWISMFDWINTNAGITLADTVSTSLAILAIIASVGLYLLSKMDNHRSFRNQLKIKIYEKLADQIWRLQNIGFKLHATGSAPPLILMKTPGIHRATPAQVFKYRSDMWLDYTKKLNDQYFEFSQHNSDTWRLIEDWQALFPKIVGPAKILFYEENQKFNQKHRDYVSKLQGLRVTDYDSWNQDEIMGWAKVYTEANLRYGIFVEDFVAMFANLSTKSLGRHRRNSRNSEPENPIKYEMLSYKGIVEKKYWGKNKLRNMWQYYVKKEKVFEE